MKNIRFLHCSGRVSNDFQTYSHDTVSSVYTAATAFYLWPPSCSLALSQANAPPPQKKQHVHTHSDPSHPSQALDRRFSLRGWPKRHCCFHSLPRDSASNYVNSNEDFETTFSFFFSVFFTTCSLVFFSWLHPLLLWMPKEITSIFYLSKKDKLCKSPNWAWQDSLKAEWPLSLTDNIIPLFSPAWLWLAK